MTATAKSVVFDCMIYAQAMISGKGPAAACIDLVHSGELRAVWSDYVLQEIRELPAKLPARLKLTPERVEAFVLDLAPLVSHQLWVEETYVNPFDRDDSHYVNLALAAGANLITSRDRDLLRLMDGSLAEGRAFRLQYSNLEILTPTALLERVRPSTSAS